MNMEKKICATGGPVEIRGKSYSYFLLSDMENHYVKIFLDHGKHIEFQRNQKVNLPSDIEAALITHGVITEGK
jgi:hypothetical protein